MAKATPTNARAAAGGESGGGRAKAGGGGASRHKQRAQSRRDAELDEIKQLEAALSANAPAPGSNPLAADHAPGTRARKFTQLPLSRLTLNGLKQHKFVSMTAIQRATLPHALCGRDVLGGAKTGSGKTLSYLIPLLEALFRHQWTPEDGLGALVISPTRELALQIFDELRRVGQFHVFSAGLVIGGKDLKAEQEHINGMNVLICTPGRLLQHMDETPYFDCSQLKVLVLDEADRILDMGFSTSLNSIIMNLPVHRQTLLFSATLSKSVKDLARLSLREPEYLSVHEDAQAATPYKLEQFYSVVELQDKLDVLHSFVKTHLQAKVIIFLSSCKQVQFMNEAFCHLRPGIPVKCLHGKMKQMKRLAAFYEFCEAKCVVTTPSLPRTPHPVVISTLSRLPCDGGGRSMVLFATDIAARGLDFPTVDWVVQADCPEDVQTYIHRVGRTARFTHSGKAFLLLLPSEESAMMDLLGQARIPLRKLHLNPKHQGRSCKAALQSLLSREVLLKQAAQKAVVSYVRSVFLQPNKALFDAHALPVEAFSESIGLPSAPRLRFLVQSANEREIGTSDHRSPRGSEGGAEHADKEKGKGSNLLLFDEAELSGDEQTDTEEQLMVLKRRNHDLSADERKRMEEAKESRELARKRKKKLKVKIHPDGGEKIVVFDDEGNNTQAPTGVDEEAWKLDLADDAVLREAASKRFSALTADMKERDKEDRRREKDRLRATKQERKRKMRDQRGEDDNQAGAPVLLSRDEEELSESDGEAPVPDIQDDSRGRKQAKTKTTTASVEDLVMNLIKNRA